jgi:hypothetical protein
VYFSFENRGPATTVKMAFPFETVGYDDRFNALLRFATKVDGKAIAVSRVKIAPITEIGESYLKQGIELAVPFALVKEVSFEANQRRTVIVDYVVTRAEFGIGGFSDSYVLHTGATWAGRIGQCSVTVDWKSVTNPGKPEMQFRRKDYSVHPSTWHYLAPRVATTVLTNIEPDFDLELTASEGFGHVTLNGLTLDPYRGTAIHDASFSGSPSDPMVLTRGLFDFFTDGYSDNRERIEGPIGDQFGNALSVTGARTLTTGQGRKLTLRRDVLDFGEYGERVYLRDVVEALGGTFKWVPEWERIDITMPTGKR